MVLGLASLLYRRRRSLCISRLQSLDLRRHLDSGRFEPPVLGVKLVISRVTFRAFSVPLHLYCKQAALAVVAIHQCNSITNLACVQVVGAGRLLSRRAYKLISSG